ncbi:MAG: DUF6449 domain-containing protein [Butyricicoccus sp.]|nr:DUF6449 domain-containing protein [Butyricicoccus sp.]
MTSNRSFFNAGLLRQTMRRNLWATVLSFVGFFFCLPLPVAMIVQGMSRDENSKAWEAILESTSSQAAGILLGTNPLVKIGMCIMAVLCGVALFNYLHTRKRVDFYHALPVKRDALFMNNYLAGILAVLPAYLLMYALALILASAVGVGGYLTPGRIAQTLLIHVLFFLLIYTISVLATILTGNTILAVLLDGWMLFSIPLVALLVQTLCETYLQTWGSSAMLNWIMKYTSPVVLYFISGNEKYSSFLSWTASRVPYHVLWGVAVLWIVLTVLALFLFRYRKSERAGTAIAFEGFKPPLKWYMVLVIALMFGIIFWSMGGSFWIWFGLLAGTVLGHIVIEMIYHFDLRSAFVHWKTMIVLAVAAVAIVVGIQRDVMGYDKWLPNEDKIEAVGFQFNLYHGGNDGYTYHNGSFGIFQPVLTDPAIIHAVHDVASECIEGLDTASHNGFVEVTYRMKNGQTVRRSYSNAGVSEETWEQLNAIRFTEDYMRHSCDIFKVDPKAEIDTLDLSIRTNADPSETTAALITDRAQALAIVQTLQEETLTLTQDIAESTIPVLRMDVNYVTVEDNNLAYQNFQYIPIYPTYAKTLSLLKQYGVEPTALSVENLQKITVSWYDTSVDAAREGSLEMEGGIADIATAENSGSVIVTDPAQMEALLQNAVLEPVAASCDVSLGLEYDDVYTVQAVFNNYATCTLYYRAGTFPKQLCETLRAGG